MLQFGSPMPPHNNNDNGPRRPQSPLRPHGAGKNGAVAPSKPQLVNGVADVKPRLTKDQHDILEAHFQQQNKPSTTTKKGFAENLGVPIDKINNWFQNRRAKVKQDAKKQQNQYNLNMGVYGAPVISMGSSQFTSRPEQHPTHSRPPMTEYYPTNTDISPICPPAQDLGPQHSLHPPSFDMHGLGSIPEADRSTLYTPDIRQSFIAAAVGPSYMQQHPAAMPAHDFFDTVYSACPSQVSLPMPHGLPNDCAPSNEPFNADFPGFSAIVTSNTPNSVDVQNSAGSISSDQSAFSAFSAATTQSPPGPAPLTDNPLVSVFSHWAADQDEKSGFGEPDENEEAFGTSFNIPHASTADQAAFWPPNGQHGQAFSQPDMYQHSNASAQAVISSPECKVNVSHMDFDNIPSLADTAYSRRNSSTTNLASTIEAIHIQNSGTPEGFKQPTQPSSIAARRQKRPTALNSNTLRSASFTSGMTGLSSPKGNNEHTLRRIRSSGITNAGAGRIQKPNPGSAQRSPMAKSFAEAAAASPKWARSFSSSSSATIGHGGNLAPPTPHTPNEVGNFPAVWQNNPAIRNYGQMPEYSSPESLSIGYSMEPASNGNYTTSVSPPSTPLDVGQWNQARLGPNNIYRDTPPQSAPATQQSFHRPIYAPPPQMESGYYSASDLPIAQPKPSHFRRPSLPGNAQAQMNDPSSQRYSEHPVQLRDLYDGNFNMSLNGMSHNVPFAPPLMPDFVPYMPPQHGADYMLQNVPQPQEKCYIFANQGPKDFN